MCLKGICYIKGGTGTVLGLDEILKESGRLLIFKPTTGIIVNKILDSVEIPKTNIPLYKYNNIKLNTYNKLLNFIKENEKVKVEDLINNLNFIS
jgi:hypothetical protein